MYDDSGSIASPTGWPNDDGNGSIHLASLSADPSSGSSWALSAAGDSQDSFNAAEVTRAVQIHPGGDVGSPGVFGAAPTIDADFDGDNDVDGADLLVWQRGHGVGTNHIAGDADGNGSVNAADLAAWRARFGTPPAAVAAPEPVSSALAAIALLMAPWPRLVGRGS
jgi:hypothetical protein